MKSSHRWVFRTSVALLVLFVGAAVSHAYVLVADRLSNRVLKYSDGGSFLNEVVNDAVSLNQPNGMAVSPDGTKLYVASLGNSRVVRYDFNGTTGTNPQVYTTATSGSTINVPASLLFSPTGLTLFASNMGAAFNATTVAQLTPNGANNGPDLGGGPTLGRSGLAYNPAGDLLVGGYGAGATGGAVLKFDAVANAWVPFIAQTPVLRGAGNLLVNGNDLYVAAGVSGNVRKYNATTAAIDNAFNISGLAFPASMTYNSGGGILIGILGATNGSGRVDRYAYDGTPLGTFALNSNANPALGFREPTGLLYVAPEPASLTLAAGVAMAIGCFRRRRTW